LQESRNGTNPHSLDFTKFFFSLFFIVFIVWQKLLAFAFIFIEFLTLKQ